MPAPGAGFFMGLRCSSEVYEVKLNEARKQTSVAFFIALAVAIGCSVLGQTVPEWVLAILGGGLLGSLVNKDEVKD